MDNMIAVLMEHVWWGIWMILFFSVFITVFIMPLLGLSIIFTTIDNWINGEDDV